MKTKSIIMASVVLLTAAGLFVTQGAPMKKSSDPFMRKKMEYSQKVLQGITLEQYAQVVTNGMQLWRMTQTNTWARIKNPEFLAKSENYRLDVTMMVQAARESNTPAILKAYTKVTEDCVDCHQNFRPEQYRQSLARLLK